MSYMNPEMVRSPRQRLTGGVQVLKDTGADGWSLAEFNWDQRPSLGIRWNGNADNVGTPQSRGIPTWFILPEELHEIIRGDVRGEK
jgi:hypothetical protein